MPKKIKKLYRASEKNSMLGGVCAGIAEYFELDPTLIRLIWTFATIISLGAGILAYLIALIVIPRK